MNPLTIKVACSNCNLRELCMPVGLNEEQLQRIDEVVAVRRRSNAAEPFPQRRSFHLAVCHSHGLLQDLRGD
jgi:hypothetical protein